MSLASFRIAPDTLIPNSGPKITSPRKCPRSFPPPHKKANCPSEVVSSLLLPYYAFTWVGTVYFFSGSPIRQSSGLSRMSAYQGKHSWETAAAWWDITRGDTGHYRRDQNRNASSSQVRTQRVPNKWRHQSRCQECRCSTVSCSRCTVPFCVVTRAPEPLKCLSLTLPPAFSENFRE